MPSALLRTTLLAITSWIIIALILWHLPPNSLTIKLAINIPIFLAISTTTLLLLYTLATISQDKFVNRQKIFRESLRRGLLTGLALITILLLKIGEVMTPPNLILLLSSLILIEIYFSKRE